MRVLVTGGAGFIGSHLVDRLSRDGADVVVVDNFDSFYDASVKRRNLADALSRPGWRLVELDLRDGGAVDRLIQKTQPDVVAHLAARAGVRPSIEDPALYTEVNVLGTVHLLQSACKLRTRPRFVSASSSSIYGDRIDIPFRENDPVDHPIRSSAATKRACELLAETFHRLQAYQ